MRAMGVVAKGAWGPRDTPPLRCSTASQSAAREAIATRDGVYS